MGWGSDVAAEAIRRLDLKYIALVPGASYRGLHDSIVNYLGNANPQMMVCLHEEHAVAIADGYARVTEKPMAVALHSNVGLMHGIMPIFNSWCGRTPVIVFGATGPVDADKRRPWIDWIHTAKDQGGMIRPFVKFDDQPASPQATVESILRAAQLATTQALWPGLCLPRRRPAGSAGRGRGRLPRPGALPRRAAAAGPRRAVAETLSSCARRASRCS